MVVNELSIEAYYETKACEHCHTSYQAGYNFAVVTCRCGCGEAVRCCMTCPLTVHPTCTGQKKQNKKLLLIIAWIYSL